MPPQTQTHIFHDPRQHAQQTVSDARPQAYSYPPQLGSGVQQSARSHETMAILEESRRWGKRALEDIGNIARDRYYEAEDDDEDDEGEGDEEFEEYEEYEDDEEY